MKLLAYYYPSWHKDERTTYNHFKEWNLVTNAKKGFNHHQQPNLPLWGSLNLSKIESVRKQILCAKEYGIDGFIVSFYWDNSRIILDHPLRNLFDIADKMDDFVIGIMWVNRAPHTKLPISKFDYLNNSYDQYFKDRMVHTNKYDIIRLIEYCSMNFFSRKSYFRVDGKNYFSIFSFSRVLNDFDFLSTRFLKKLRGLVKKLTGSDIFICPIVHNSDDWIKYNSCAELNGVTSYLLLPDWKGPYIQNYDELLEPVSQQWKRIKSKVNTIYIPSVPCGWDSSPRGKESSNGDFLEYPWYPIVINNLPIGLLRYLTKALEFNKINGTRYILVASWNEWSEGHYLEPDSQLEYQRLEVIRLFKMQIQETM
jgi:hypothetical protein